MFKVYLVPNHLVQAIHVACMNAHNIMESIDASCWPTTHGGKKVRWPFVFKITQHTNNWEANILLT